MAADGHWSERDAAVSDLRYRHLAREGAGPPLLLVHGIGPGTTGRANFDPLLAVLPLETPVHLIDLIGFGGSERKPEQPGFDVPLWLDQIGQVLDRIGQPAILVGNSVGGALALKTAARRRDLHAVLAIGAPAAAMAPTPELEAFWRAPRDQDELARAMQPMTAAQLPPAPQLVMERWKAFSDAAYAAWFSETLSRPQDCLSAVALSPDEAARITAPVRILQGRLDRACPAQPMVDFVFEHLPQADLTLLGGSGHNLIAERTADVLAAINLLKTRNSNR